MSYTLVQLTAKWCLQAILVATLASTRLSGQYVLNSTGLTKVGKSEILLTLVNKCQMKKDIAIQKTATLMHPVPIPIKVMSQIGINLMRMKETPDGYNYVISAIRLFYQICGTGCHKGQVCSDSWVMDLWEHFLQVQMIVNTMFNTITNTSKHNLRYRNYKKKIQMIHQILIQTV